MNNRSQADSRRLAGDRAASRPNGPDVARRSGPSFTGTRDVEVLFDPRSVAVVGASDDPAKWGHHLAVGALEGSHRRDVFLVNPRGGRVLGVKTYRSLSELPIAPELVAIAVPSSAFRAVAEQSLGVRARAIVGITSGLGERHEEIRRWERAFAANVRREGSVLLRPNCAGVADSTSEFRASWAAQPIGPVGFVSQSGNLVEDLGSSLEEVGLGFSRIVTLGNQADVSAADFVLACAMHPATELIACYVEDFRDGRRFVEAASAAVAAGKPVLVLTVGRSSAGIRSARSHTGAIVSDGAAVDAACRAAGARRVSSPEELSDLAQALLLAPPLRGTGVAVVGDGGGHCGIAADLLGSRGLHVHPLSDQLRTRLAERLPATSVTTDPVDLSGAGERDLGCYPRAIDVLLRSAEVDGILLTGYLGGYAQFGPSFALAERDAAERVSALAATYRKPVVVHTIYPVSETARVLREGGVPTYRSIESAVRALASLARIGPSMEQTGGRAPEPPGSLDRASDPEAHWWARELLREAGVPVVDAVRARSRGEVRMAGRMIGYPLVLKAVGYAHKMSAGGVVLNIQDEGSLDAAARALERRLGVRDFAVEPMVPAADAVEVLVGVHRDPAFGPILVVGSGGVDVEQRKDVASIPAPVTAQDVIDLLRSLKGCVAHNPADEEIALAAVARIATTLMAMMVDRPAVIGIEINPLLVSPGGVCALDVLVAQERRPPSEEAGIG